MKCSYCEENKCKREYGNRNNCAGSKENIDCSCLCRDNPFETAIATTSAIVSGSTMFVGGTVLSLIPGLGKDVGRPTMTAGANTIMNPIKKIDNGDRVTLKEVVGDVVDGLSSGFSYFFNKSLK